MLKKKWVFFIPVIIAIVVLFALKQNKKEPARSPAIESATHVRVISVPSVSVIPRATGYGTVKPSSNWRAIAQVKGKIIFKHPKLEKGAFINALTEVIKIDPTDYELSLAQTQADIAATKAQLAELKIKASNTRLSLAIEQRTLKLTEKELQRQKKLVKKGGISFSDLERQERNLLNQQQIVQNQKNALNLLPTQQALLEAQLLRQQTQIQSIQRDLDHTQIALPFTGRVAEVNIEENQYIREGELLTSLDSLDKAEIEVQLPLNALRSILNSNKNINAEQLFSGQRQLALELKAQVALKIGDERIYWQGHFARISDTLDPKTRTVGVIVEVDKPYAEIQPGIRPPLVKGLFVEVTLTGSAQDESIIVPNSAIHNSDRNKQKLIYVVNDQGRLEIRPVTIKLTQDEYSIIRSGLKADEVIVLSELLPAIENMLLSVQKDEQVKQRLIEKATNQNSLAVEKKLIAEKNTVRETEK